MGNTGVRIFEAVMLPIQRLPLRFHYFWGDVVAWFMKNVMRYRRDVILTNIARSFPEKKYGEIRKLTDAFYTHFGELLAETIWFGGCKGRPQRLRRQRICEYKGVPDLIPVVGKRGAVILDSHFGNWELVGGLCHYVYEQDIPFDYQRICIAHRDLKSKFFEKFIEHNRCAVVPGFVGYVETADILRYAIKHRHDREGIIYIFITDQHPYKGYAQTRMPDFMHQKTTTVMGGAALAHKFGLPVIYMSLNKVSRGHYECHFPVICEDASKEDPVEIMKKYYALLEKDINSNPTNYLWSHKRWK